MDSAIILIQGFQAEGIAGERLRIVLVAVYVADHAFTELQPNLSSDG